MYVDPFSAEYVESCYDQRAEMYVDSWFDQYSAVEDYCPNPSSIIMVPVELVDDLPF